MGSWISFVYATIQHMITFLGGDNWKTWKLARIFPWTQVIFNVLYCSYEGESNNQKHEGRKRGVYQQMGGKDFMWTMSSSKNMLGHMVFLGIKKDICERDVACETFVFCAWQCHIGPCNIRLWKYHDLGTKENNSS
jgi:hypothetical protein